MFPRNGTSDDKKKEVGDFASRTYVNPDNVCVMRPEKTIRRNRAVKTQKIKNKQKLHSFLCYTHTHIHIDKYIHCFVAVMLFSRSALASKQCSCSGDAVHFSLGGWLPTGMRGRAGNQDTKSFHQR